MEFKKPYIASETAKVSLFLLLKSCILHINTQRKEEKNMKQYKWEDVEGARFYTNGTTCTDIDIPAGVKTVSLIYPKIEIGRHPDKVFTDVEELRVGRNVIGISIPNRMFPNVKTVVSKSSCFLDSKYLVERTGFRLLNAFEQTEDTPIDFSQFIRVNPYAFDGCKSKSIINLTESHVLIARENAFAGSGFMELPFVDGLKRCGSVVFDVDEDADDITLPKEKLHYFPKKRVKCAKVQNIKNMKIVSKMPKKIILEDDDVSSDDAILHSLGGYGIEEIVSDVPRYKSKDGILYSSDMKTLILCPSGNTGIVIIPEGVTRIRKGAFRETQISGVIFPDSLVSLEDDVFNGCQNLKTIDFGHGITDIGQNGRQEMFYGCAVEKIVFPKQVKSIGINAFMNCQKLKEVVFNEGLETIAAGAFRGCPNLSNINLPKSIKKVGKMAFFCDMKRAEFDSDVEVNISSIPLDFINAFVYPGKINNARCLNVHIDNENGKFDFVIPEAAAPTGFSQMRRYFNDMSDGEYKYSKRHLDSAYQWANYPKDIAIAAFKTYKMTKTESAKEYLKEKPQNVAKALILNMTERDFVEFVKFGFADFRCDELIMQMLKEKGWTSAIAYVLNQEREGKGLSTELAL